MNNKIQSLLTSFTPVITWSLGYKTKAFMYSIHQSEIWLILYIFLHQLYNKRFTIHQLHNTNPQEIMGWEYYDVFRFDLSPLLQGQMSVAKLKSAYNSLIIGPRVLGPSFRSSDGALALVSCLSGRYSLHRFSNVLGLDFT